MVLNIGYLKHSELIKPGVVIVTLDILKETNTQKGTF